MTRVRPSTMATWRLTVYDVWVRAQYVFHAAPVETL